MKLWFYIMRLLCVTLGHLRFYKLKSKVYRWVWESALTRAPVPLFTCWNDIMQDVTFMKWKPDGWPELGDAVSSAEGAQWKIERARQGREYRGGFDCDEFAITIVARLIKAAAKPDIDLVIAGQEVVNVSFCSMFWLDGWKIVGHNVALIASEKGDVWWWGCADYRTDYNLFRLPLNAIKDKVDYMSKGKGKFLCAVVMDENLGLREVMQ